MTDNAGQMLRNIRHFSLPTTLAYQRFNIRLTPQQVLVAHTSTHSINTRCIYLVLQAATSVVIITTACTPNFININEYSANKF